MRKAILKAAAQNPASKAAYENFRSAEFELQYASRTWLPIAGASFTQLNANAAPNQVGRISNPFAPNAAAVGPTLLFADPTGILTLEACRVARDGTQAQRAAYLGAQSSVALQLIQAEILLVIAKDEVTSYQEIALLFDDLERVVVKQDLEKGHHRNDSDLKPLIDAGNAAITQAAADLKAQLDPDVKVGGELREFEETEEKLINLAQDRSGELRADAAVLSQIHTLRSSVQGLVNTSVAQLDTAKITYRSVVGETPLNSDIPTEGDMLVLLQVPSKEDDAVKIALEKNFAVQMARFAADAATDARDMEIWNMVLPKLSIGNSWTFAGTGLYGESQPFKANSSSGSVTVLWTVPTGVDADIKAKDATRQALKNQYKSAQIATDALVRTYYVQDRLWTEEINRQVNDFEKQTDSVQAVINTLVNDDEKSLNIPVALTMMGTLEQVEAQVTQAYLQWANNRASLLNTLEALPSPPASPK